MGLDYRVFVIIIRGEVSASSVTMRVQVDRLFANTGASDMRAASALTKDLPQTHSASIAPSKSSAENVPLPGQRSNITDLEYDLSLLMESVQTFWGLGLVSR